MLLQVPFLFFSKNIILIWHRTTIDDVINDMGDIYFFNDFVNVIRTAESETKVFNGCGYGQSIHRILGPVGRSIFLNSVILQLAFYFATSNGSYDG